MIPRWSLPFFSSNGWISNLWLQCGHCNHNMPEPSFRRFRKGFGSAPGITTAGQLGCGQGAYWQKISVFGTRKDLCDLSQQSNTRNPLGSAFVTRIGNSSMSDRLPQRLVRSNSGRMSSNGVGKIVCSNSWECLPSASLSVHRYKRPPIPVRVSCQIEQASLRRSLCDFDLEVVPALGPLATMEFEAGLNRPSAMMFVRWRPAVDITRLPKQQTLRAQITHSNNPNARTIALPSSDSHSDCT
jgi:hypothetical protein